MTDRLRKRRISHTSHIATLQMQNRIRRVTPPRNVNELRAIKLSIAHIALQSTGTLVDEPGGFQLIKVQFF